MTNRQRIVRERRQYNQWVASQTLEDYALRYTAARARRSIFRVGSTAFGPIAFLACEAIGGTITLAYGFANAAWAIVGFCALMFAIGLPICYYAARDGVDIDLLTRGAGFGYIGSTITSLIYASFTFLLFAIEASILSTALALLFGIPIAIAHLLSALVVIPIAVYGISLISRMQIATQPIWLVLQLLPLAWLAWSGAADLEGWTAYGGAQGTGGSVDWLLLGLAASILLSLLPQIGEQVDYLRFLPERTPENSRRWWATLLFTGPGWVGMGGLKLLAGSFLAYLLVREGVAAADADEPTVMYLLAFERTFQSPTVALVLTGVFVVVCQLKINVTNAYAGSIAWSNFFSRVTHSHPGRVVWLVFNVLLALLLMEIGIFRAIENILGIYANFAAGWIGALTADLVVNKPLGLSPKHIEFKRAHLYDVNPVGVGALGLSIVLSSLAYLGALGPVAQILSPFVALGVAFLAAPLIAWITRGRYYLARDPDPLPAGPEIRCTICENAFESRDMAMCPAYSGPICSLCCTLESRCHDACKPEARVGSQVRRWIERLPRPVAAALETRAGRFFGLLIAFNLAAGLLLLFIHAQSRGGTAAAQEAVRTTLWLVWLSGLVVSGIVTWLVVLAWENRRAAEAETSRQTAMLMEEIEAHKRTDAALQRAKEVAEAANIAKSRYIVGLSHEIRTPLNAIYGYAQLLERARGVSSGNAVRVIRRSAEHLSGLIDGLLDISRIEGGVLRLSRDRVALWEVLDQLEDMFRLQASGKGIDFRCERSPRLPRYVYADQKRLRQVLINLLSNAVKYTERGGAALVVRYRNQVAEFECSDTGVGIPPEELDRVFEPFERGRSSAVRAVPGTGLGLTITKLLVQIMGGEILVQSTVGEGTRFTVRLLLSEAPAPQAAGGAAEQRRIQGYRGPRRTVLLVDDDPAHLDLVTQLLRGVDFHVVAADNAAAGLELAREMQPDLAMVDLSLPDASGWDVARAMRADPRLRATRILMVSANAHEYTPGGDGDPHHGFVMKPVELQQLLEAVRAQLRLEWIHEVAAEPAAPATDAIPPIAGGSRHHLEDLYQLGLIGHVRGIQGKLAELEAEDAANAPLVAHLRAILDRFDMKRYMSEIEVLRAAG